MGSGTAGFKVEPRATVGGKARKVSQLNGETGMRRRGRVGMSWATRHLGTQARPNQACQAG